MSAAGRFTPENQIEAAAAAVTAMRAANGGDIRRMARRGEPVVDRRADPAALHRRLARAMVAGDQQDDALATGNRLFEAAVDRVSTVSSERGRAVKLSIAGGRLTLSVTNPDSGSATEELEVDYDSEPLDIGFNSRYLLDIAAQIEGEVAVLKLADPGSPTLIQDKDSGNALYVLMPMRV